MSKKTKRPNPILDEDIYNVFKYFNIPFGSYLTQGAFRLANNPDEVAILAYLVNERINDYNKLIKQEKKERKKELELVNKKYDKKIEQFEKKKSELEKTFIRLKNNQLGDILKDIEENNPNVNLDKAYEDILKRIRENQKKFKSDSFVQIKRITNNDIKRISNTYNVKSSDLKAKLKNNLNKTDLREFEKGVL